MEQIQELLEILKQTPEMAIWALTLYFLFILLKLASWVVALKLILQQFIKRYFDYKEESLKGVEGAEIASYFEDAKIGSVNKGLLIELLSTIKNGNSSYIHKSNIIEAIRKIRS